MRSHKSPLDRDVELLMRWGNKTLSHIQLEVSFLKCTQSGICAPGCCVLARASDLSSGFTLMAAVKTSRADLAAALASSGLVASRTAGRGADATLDR